MYSTIKNFCENEKENGLCFLDMPTGSGKSTAVVKYMYDIVQNNNNKKKFFYLTTIKKNIPEEDLKNYFKAAGKVDLYYEKVLRIDPNYESVVSGLTAETIYDIPDKIKETKEYKRLEQYVNLVKRLRNEPKMQGILKITEDTLMQDIEPVFRKYVQRILWDKFDQVEERIRAIKEERKWSWIGKLYPSVFLNERQIILMSLDKFLTVNSTIVDSPCILYNSEIIDKSVIFIDECDATKETVLNNIIQSIIKDKRDYIRLFRTIQSSLHKNIHIFPTSLTSLALSKTNAVQVEKIIEKAQEIADSIYNDFSLQYSLKAKQKKESDSINFLFQDHRFISLANGKKRYVRIHTNKKEKQNIIEFSNEKPEKDIENIQVLLSRIRGFLSFFTKTVQILAINYESKKRNSPKPISLEHAVVTVLNEFNIDREDIASFCSKILSNTRERNIRLRKTDFDFSFYENGFRYYCILDSEEHDTISKIMYKSVQVTPEKFMLMLAQRAKVFGISATSTIPSVIGNYDIDYLKGKLQDEYIPISDEDRERLQLNFRNSINGYDKVNIHTQLIGVKEYSVEAWKEVTAYDEVAKHLFDIVDRACTSENQDNNYNKERYFRIAVVFKEFLTKSNIRSFLCILTKHPREYDLILNWNVLMDIFNVIVKERNIPFNLRGEGSNVVLLDSNDYEAKKEQILERLGAGERMFVFSTYATIGAGQNLQYRIPDDLKDDLVKINDFPSRGKKDFDGIYLDLPTNLIADPFRLGDEETVLRYICHIEMLKEKGEISPKDASILIKQAFKCGDSKMAGGVRISINNCRSILALSTRQIIQAVGRICRTNQKSKDIYIFADERISHRMDYEICKGRLFNIEFESLLSKLKESAAAPLNEEIQCLTNHAILISERVNKYINYLVKEKWNDGTIETWKELRDFTLKYPTLSSNLAEDIGIGQNFYIKLPNESNRVFYDQENDFDSVNIYFTHMPKTATVSEEASKLTDLMKIDVIKQYFLQEGYATSFERSHFIMCPPLFNNIYRGALGEVAGKVLFSYCANVELEEITDISLFEKFDFKVPFSSIYVDFKNWHEGTFVDSTKQVHHIVEKAHACKCNCVIVANIVGRKQWQIQEHNVDDIKVIVVPALVDVTDKPEPEFIEPAWKRIRECIHGYSN